MLTGKWAHEQEAWLTAAVASKFLVPCAQEFYKEVWVDAKIPMELVCKGKDSFGMLSTVPAIQRIGKEKILCEQHSSKNPTKIL